MNRCMVVMLLCNNYLPLVIAMEETPELGIITYMESQATEVSPEGESNDDQTSFQEPFTEENFEDEESRDGS